MLGLFKRNPKSKRKPDTIVLNDNLGTFTLTNFGKTGKIYRGRINWLGEDVYVTLFPNDIISLNADKALENLRRIAENAADWDKRLRQYAAEDMSDNGKVEIWGDGASDDIPSPITTKEFMNRISLGFIHIHPDGYIYFDYDLDGMFTDHGLGIDANISGEIFSAGLEG